MKTIYVGSMVIAQNLKAQMQEVGLTDEDFNLGAKLYKRWTNRSSWGLDQHLELLNKISSVIHTKGCYGYIAVVANNLYFSDRFDLVLQQLSGLKEVKDISKDLEFKLGLAYSSAYAIVMGYKPASNKLLEALGQHYRTKILVCFSPNDNCFGPYINFSPAEDWELQGWNEDLLKDIRSQIDLVPHYEEVEEDDSPIAYEEVGTKLDSIFNGQESSFDLVTAFKGLDKAQRDLVLAFAQTRAKLDKDKELIVLEYCLSRIKDNSIEDLITSMSNQNTF